MARQLSLFDDNPIPKDHVGGFCDFLPPELHDFGRLGRLTLIIAEDRETNNDFIRYLATFVGGDDWKGYYCLAPTHDWLSFMKTNSGQFMSAHPNPVSLITETKRIKLLIDDCHFTGCARLRSAYNAFLNFESAADIDADIFVVDRATRYMQSDGLEAMRKVYGVSIVGNFLVTRKH